MPIEVVLSDDAVFGERMLTVMKKLGKVPIITADVECFAADDIFSNYIIEAVRIFEEGIATPAQVDKIVNDAVGGGGPFNVMDLTHGNLLVAHLQELMRDAKGGTQVVCAAGSADEAGKYAVARSQGSRRFEIHGSPAKAGAGPHSAGVARALFRRG